MKRPGSPLGLAGDPGGVPLYRDGLVVGRRRAWRGRRLRHRQRSRRRRRAARGERRARRGRAASRRRRSIRAERDPGRRHPPAVRERERPRRPEAGPAAGPGSSCARPPPPSSLVAGHRGRRRGARRPALPDRAPARVLTRGGRGRDPRPRRRASRRARGPRSASRSARTRASRSPWWTSTGACSASSRTRDAPNFGIDVSVQKARTAALLQQRRARAPSCARRPRRLPASDVPLDGSVAYTLARRRLPGPALLPARHRRHRLRAVLAADRRVEPLQHRPAARPRSNLGGPRARCTAIARPAQRHHDLPGRHPALQGRPARRRDRRQRRRRRPGRPDRRRRRRRLRGPRREALRPARGARRAAAVGEVPAAPGAVSADAAADRGIARARSPRLRGTRGGRRGAGPEGRAPDPGHPARPARRAGRLPDHARRGLLGAGGPTSCRRPLDVDPPADRQAQLAGPEGRAEASR